MVHGMPVTRAADARLTKLTIRQRTRVLDEWPLMFSPLNEIVGRY
jgi:hypothetical protein